jgi:hypothetical protein
VLRGCLVAVGVAGVALGVFLLSAGQAIAGAIELVLVGSVLTLALLLERRGYRPRVNRSSGHWEETSERFIDPASGHLIEVRYNPETGERDYVDTGPAG